MEPFHSIHYKLADVSQIKFVVDSLKILLNLWGLIGTNHIKAGDLCAEQVVLHHGANTAGLHTNHCAVL